MSKTSLPIIAVVLFVVGIIIGLLIPSPLAPAPAPATVTMQSTVTAAPAKLTLALLVSNLGNPYFVALRDGALQAANELKAKGVNIELLVYDAKDDPALQTSQIETAVGMKVSAILINPVHMEAVQPALKKAVAAGIPVVTTDRDVANTSLRMVFIGTDNVKGAEQAAQELVKALKASGRPKPWKVVILNGILGTTAAEDRKKGFHNVLDPLVKDGSVVIVAEEVANFRRDQGLSVTESVLAKGRFDALIAANDEMALGAIQAIEGAGLKPGVDVIVVGYDAISDAVDSVRAGKMYATIAQSPFLQGYWAVYAAFYRCYFNWKPTVSWIPTPTVVVTKANVDTFSTEVASPKPLP
jgi:ribose transport system substrate-binding protein